MTRSGYPQAALPRSRWSIFARAVGVLIAWHVILDTAVTVWIETQPTFKADGTCDGIGWGCTPNPHDAAILVTFFFILPVQFGGLLLGLVLAAALLASRLRSGILIGTIAAIIGVATAAAVGLALHAIVA